MSRFFGIKFGAAQNLRLFADGDIHLRAELKIPEKCCGRAFHAADNEKPR
jgi:hypothetical protein